MTLSCHQLLDETVCVKLVRNTPRSVQKLHAAEGSVAFLTPLPLCRWTEKSQHLDKSSTMKKLGQTSATGLVWQNSVK